MAQPENRLSKRMADRIRTRGGWARKIHQGPTGAGMLDIAAVYRGYAIHIETKMPGKENNVTKLQQETINKIKAAGGIALVMSSVKQVDRLLDKIDKVKEAKNDNRKGKVRKGR